MLSRPSQRPRTCKVLLNELYFFVTIKDGLFTAFFNEGFILWEDPQAFNELEGFLSVDVILPVDPVVQDEVAEPRLLALAQQQQLGLI